ncbi:DUF2357 domain-containing protein [Alkalicoccobacillus plakortidis]|uniref:DUF2357 domain-containing protein n=1 Tax=Alkalicoccobacillus plakortidis TaxID=444060 RepID=A0ABT0XKH7_9BACI|nr:DUF2357 domain-containing protein [Alkalicoccobacillus plakortidis]MCM2676412.1 DUF2357 domain-containing protein [Alkalicoccobacillus plakortidis]
MLALNQFVIKWEDTNIQLEIQMITGEKGSIIQLEDSKPNVFGYLSAENKEEEFPTLGYNIPKLNMFHSLLLREESSYLLKILLPKKHLEESDFSSPFANSYVNHFIKLFPSNIWRKIRINEQEFIEVLGELHTKNFVGTLDLSINNRHSFLCEVAAKKVNYENSYSELLNNIAEESSNLIMQFSGLTSTKVLNDNSNSIIFSKVIQLRSIMKELPLAIDIILNNIHSNIDKESILEPIGFGHISDYSSITSKSYVLDLQVGGTLNKKFRGYTPQKIISDQSKESIDTVENRYVKNFLEETHYLVNNLVRQIRLVIKKSSKNKLYKIYISETNSWLTILEDYLNNNIFRKVSKLKYFPSNSQVLQNRVGYQDLLLLDLRLQSGLSLSWNPIEAITSDVYVKPIYELYEIWCFFIIRNSLGNIFGTENKESNVWYQENGSINFNLKKGTNSCLVYQRNKIKVNLYYNKEFSKQTTLGKSYSIKLRPDFTIFISDSTRRENGYYIHFDAKYRIEKLNQYHELDTKTSKKDDLVKMHAYKDAIDKSLGSYVLYPGNEFINFQESSTILPGIGAIPLIPNINDTKNKFELFLVEITNFITDKILKNK